MEHTTEELQKWRELRERFPASAWVALWYAKLLKQNDLNEYEKLKPRLLLSFFDRKRFHQFDSGEEAPQKSGFPQNEPAHAEELSVKVENEPVAQPVVEEEKNEIPQQKHVETPQPAKTEHNNADEEIIDNLIEKFSNDPPKIQFNPEIHDENFNYGKSSCIENPEIISETLAVIYAEQGYVGKAIKIYKKLSLHNPEKSCYFADQIKKLKIEKK
ncbi:MAG: hypothetical protein J6W84_02580 [Bacteroidales bacterium]|nr:hypothetical protein [Bacteroidales bacterium]